LKLTEETRQILEASWNRQLYFWWNYYNESYLNEALTRPIIRIGNSERSLGLWDGRNRTLTISKIHIRKHPWLSVMETLRHEMAHQYAYEVLGAHDEVPHGTAFRDACRRLRCSPRTGASEHELATGEHRDARILRVLKKILSLASSPNENEAQAAVQKARQFLMKYNIDLVELDEDRNFEARCLGSVKGRRTSAELWMASLLNRFFFVEVLWVQSYEATRDRSGTILQIYGTPENLDMAEYVNSFLLGLLDQFWENYKVMENIGNNKERQRYFVGVLEGFYRKLESQEKYLEKTQALVWQGDSRLKSFFKFLNPRVETRYGGGVSQTAAYEGGYRDGQKVVIHRPVESRGKRLAGFLGK